MELYKKCLKQVEGLRQKQEPERNRITSLEMQSIWIINVIHDLTKLSKLNYAGFLQIIKKHYVNHNLRKTGIVNEEYFIENSTMKIETRVQCSFKCKTFL